MAAAKMPHNGVDEEVLKSAQAGNSAAYEQVVNYYSTSVYNLAFRMTGDRDAAGDVTQEVFVRLYTRFYQYDPSRPFEPWFYRLAVNVCRNYLQRTRRYEAPLSQITHEPDETWEWPAPTESPLEAGAARELAAIVRQEVGNLPVQYREVVVLRYLKGFSYDQLTDILQLPMGTVKNRLFRAREMLKERLRRLQSE